MRSCTPGRQDAIARSAMDATVTPALPRGADHIAPDCAGQNFYAGDRGLRDLLALYLSPDDFQRLGPHFDRLGALAGGRLDELARLAHKHPPGLKPRHRLWRGAGWVNYPPPHPEIGKIAF